ncbi:MAG: CapA family protein [Oscillospiraceae bacterium]|nr:CapA family protein [Oscillospiraceae bacterium]
MTKRNRSPHLMLAVIICAVSVIALVSAVIVMTAKEDAEPVTAEPIVSQPVESVEPLPEPEPEPEPEPSVVKFMAAGDNLIHDNFYKQAAARAGGNGFDFGMPYSFVEPLFADSDLSFVNQETIIAESIFPLSGYPLFNSPEAVGNRLVEMGFDVVSIANNHMFDMGEKGLIAALDFWQSKENLLTIGAWRKESDMQQPLLYEKNGITFGFVPITEHTNGIKLPKDTELRFIRSDEYDLMEQQVKLARENSDFVVVSIHWGTENSVNVNDNQLYLAQMFADWGVDLVLGHHSHTLQPMEWRTGKEGNKTLVVYSLGNLVSSMLNPQNMLGGVLDLEITMEPDQKPEITRAKMIPIVTQYDTTARREVRIYPFSDYTQELMDVHGVAANYPHFTIQYMQDIIDKNIPEEFLD